MVMAGSGTRIYAAIAGQRLVDAALRGRAEGLIGRIERWLRSGEY